MPRSKHIAKSKAEKEGKKIKKLTSQKVGRKADPAESGVKRKYRSKPGRKAMREIKRYQKTTELLMQKAPFHRKSKSLTNVVKQILKEMNFETEKFRFQSAALHALQEATEAAIVSLLEDANLCCSHAHRKTVMRSDVLLARRIRGERF